MGDGVNRVTGAGFSHPSMGGEGRQVSAARSAAEKRASRHTPGPWIYSGGEVYSSRALDLDGYPVRRLALMDREESSTSPWERDANARLMAAAPELLAAAEQAQIELLRFSMGAKENPECPQRALASLRAAIQKARGLESP